MRAVRLTFLIAALSLHAACEWIRSTVVGACADITPDVEIQVPGRSVVV